MWGERLTRSSVSSDRIARLSMCRTIGSGQKVCQTECFLRSSIRRSTPSGFAMAGYATRLQPGGARLDAHEKGRPGQAAFPTRLRQRFLADRGYSSPALRPVDTGVTQSRKAEEHQYIGGGFRNDGCGRELDLFNLLEALPGRTGHGGRRNRHRL